MFLTIAKHFYSNIYNIRHYAIPNYDRLICYYKNAMVYSLFSFILALFVFLKRQLNTYVLKGWNRLVNTRLPCGPRSILASNPIWVEVVVGSCLAQLRDFLWAQSGDTFRTLCNSNSIWDARATALSVVRLLNFTLLKQSWSAYLFYINWI